MKTNNTGPLTGQTTAGDLQHGLRNRGSGAVPGRALLALAMLLTLAGCEAIGTIFEAGVWVGVIVVIAIVAVVAVIASVLRR